MFTTAVAKAFFIQLPSTYTTSVTRKLGYYIYHPIRWFTTYTWSSRSWINGARRATGYKLWKALCASRSNSVCAGAWCPKIIVRTTVTEKRKRKRKKSKYHAYNNPEIIYASSPWCCTAYAGTGRLPISIRHWGHVLCRSNQLSIHAAQNVWPGDGCFHC